MALAQEDIEFIKAHLGEWLAEQSLARPIAGYEMGLRERMVRVEEALQHQRELMYEGFKAMDKRFEALQLTMDKRFESVERRFEAVDKHFEIVQADIRTIQSKPSSRTSRTYTVRSICRPGSCLAPSGCWQRCLRSRR